MSITNPAGTKQPEPLDAALARVDAALRAMWAGDPSGYIDAWERSGDVSDGAVPGAADLDPSTESRG